MAIGFSACIVLSGVLGYVFQVQGTLEVVKIIEKASGDNPQKQHEDQGRLLLSLFLSGLPWVLLGTMCGLCYALTK